MPQRVSQKPTVQFNRGLITEAGELTFPEGASVDELNMTLERSGSRRRRLGLAYEENHVLNDTLLEGQTTAVSIWENAGGVAGLNFVVVQMANKLHFYRESEGALSSNKEPFFVSLSSFNRPTGFGASTVPVQTTTLEGILIVASSEINTIRVDYNDVLNIVTAEEIDFRFRDFTWQGDTSTYYTEVKLVDASEGRKYDTRNVGWKDVDGTNWGVGGGDALITYLQQENNKIPPLTHPWYAGINASTGFFDVATWQLIHTGSSLTANGTYILSLYDQDREAVSGFTGLNTPETSRFKTVANYAGRVFYAGMSNDNTDKIYFSQILVQNENLGDCFQVNDPTSEVISDLLDTDGGVIQVNGAYNIKKLHVLGPYLVVFAENGVWLIRGVDDVFRATEFSVSKITEVGLASIGSFVSADGRPYWWSNSGIHTIVANEAGSLSEKSLTIDTIQTFWGAISPGKRQQVKAAYDAFNKRVFWFYPDNTETIDNKVSRAIIFDETLTAFYPWSIAEADASQYALDPFFLSGNLTSSVTFNVVDSNGDQVIDSSGNNVTVTRDSRDYISSNITMLVRDATGAVTFAQFTDTGFLDWGSANYSSYVEGNYDFTGDLTLKKSPFYTTIYLEVTEEGLTGDDVSGYTAIRPSSCMVSSYWDFSTTPSNALQQAYRLKRLSMFTSTTWDYPVTVTTSRLRIRGRGRSYRLRFESEQGKDFHLLGFDSLIGKNPR